MNLKFKKKSGVLSTSLKISSGVLSQFAKFSGVLSLGVLTVYRCMVDVRFWYFACLLLVHRVSCLWLMIKVLHLCLLFGSLVNLYSSPCSFICAASSPFVAMFSMDFVLSLLASFLINVFSIINKYITMQFRYMQHYLLLKVQSS